MKRIVLLIVTLLVSMNFYAQLWDNSKPDQRFTFGVRAGANLSTLGVDDDYYDYYKNRWGFHGGFVIDYNIVKSFAVETGLFYTGKGAKYDKERSYYSYYKDESLKFNYLQIPILAELRLPVSDDASVQVKGGGYFGYLINEPETLKVKKPDIGIIFGAGISYKKVYLGLQYELGLYDAYTFGKEGDYLRNRNLAISVGYDF